MEMKDLQNAWYTAPPEVCYCVQNMWWTISPAFSRKDDYEIIIIKIIITIFIAFQSWHLNSKVDQAFMVVLKNHNNVRVISGPGLASLLFPLSRRMSYFYPKPDAICLKCAWAETKGRRVAGSGGWWQCVWVHIWMVRLMTSFLCFI